MTAPKRIERPITFYDFLPVKLRDRIVLDYPLDVLLDRKCELTAYEDGLYRELIGLHRAIRGLFSVKSAEELVRLRRKVEPCTRPDQYGALAKDALPADKEYLDACSTLLSNRGTTQAKTTSFGGLRIPTSTGESSEQATASGKTGNILIRGRPGTCKSTLALQLAAACTFAPNNYLCVFVSLEESWEQVSAKCREMRWNSRFVCLDQLTSIDGSSSSEEMAMELDRFLWPECTQSDLCLPESKVLLPMLSPRSLRPSSRSGTETFQVRYEQLERLLRAFRWMRAHELRHETTRKNEGNWPFPRDQLQLPHLRMVCIDSLSALAERPLTREELYRVFDLFTTYGVVGVVTAEDQPGENADAMDYLADVVINLRAEQDRGYALRYLEIVKSRHQHQVYGVHPFVVRNYQEITAGEAVARRRGGSAADMPAPALLPKPGLGPGSVDAPLTPAARTSQDLEEDSEPASFFQSIMVYPSIHHVVASTRGRYGPPSSNATVLDGQPVAAPSESQGGENTAGAPDQFDIGVDNLTNILTHKLGRGSIVTIMGPRGTYKTHLARNFLLAGIGRKESGLLIHLGERVQFQPHQWRDQFCPACEALVREPTAGGGQGGSCCALQSSRPPPDLYRGVSGASWFMSDEVQQRFDAMFAGDGHPPTCGCRRHLWCKFDWGEEATVGLPHKNTAKFVRNSWICNTPSCPSPVLVELDFKPGALLPEQFIKLVRDIFRQLRDPENPGRSADVRRIVVDDVSLIGTSYPFLRESRTSGDLFLSAFVHLARFHECDVVLLGTSGEFSEADDVVKRAATLADSVLTCDFCDVFGARFITVTGQGLMVGRARDPANTKRSEYGEYVPGVIVPKRDGLFNVDLERLEGLVGFEQRSVHRPGIVVSVFSEGAILGGYNEEIRTMLARAFASPAADHRPGIGSSAPQLDADVSVLEFGSGKSAPLHESLRVLHGKPIDKTVVCALDEFFQGPDTGTPEQRSREVLCDLAQSQNVELWKDYRPEVWPGDQQPKSVLATPYYSNVLVLAYNRTLVGDAGGGWLQDVSCKYDDFDRVYQKVTSWGNLARVVDSLETPGAWGFECGTWSSETLACVVLDAFLHTVRARRSQPLSLRELLDQAGHKDNLSSLTHELNGLRSLFSRSMRAYHRSELIDLDRWQLPDGTQRTTWSGDDKLRRRLKKEERTYREKLVANAAVYVCWYSQLRELIAENPDLAPKLKVAALPGGGIRGDWYLGVVRGSVSVKLGLNIIEILGSRSEDNRRYIKGVGLPVHRYVPHLGHDTSYAGDEQQASAFASEPRMAWQRGKVGLSTLLCIHKAAWARSQLEGYQETRETLGTVGRQVAFPARGDVSDQEPLDGLIRRVRSIVAGVSPRTSLG